MASPSVTKSISKIIGSCVSTSNSKLLSGSTTSSSKVILLSKTNSNIFFIYLKNHVPFIISLSVISVFVANNDGV